MKKKTFCTYNKMYVFNGECFNGYTIFNLYIFVSVLAVKVM